MIGSNEQDVSALFALVVHLFDGFVRLRACLNGCLVDSSVANHVWWGKVVHEELKLACSNALAELVGNRHGAHLGLQVVRCYLGRWHHLALLIFKLLFYTTVEEEGDVGVLLRLCNVTLLHALLAKCLRENIRHTLGLKGDVECVLGVIRSHGREVDVLGVWEIRLGRAIEVPQQLGNLTYTVRTVVEEEDGVVI